MTTETSNARGEVCIVCDWKDADPFPRFIEAEIAGKSVSLEWSDRADGLKELVVPVSPTAAIAERVAVLTAHRACHSAEHDPENGRIHGYCIVCGVPFPCEYVGEPSAPPPAAARGDVRGLVSLAGRVQYADTHAQVSKDNAGEFVCLPPWLWLEIRDAAAEALAAEGVQAGEVSAEDVAVLHRIKAALPDVGVNGWYEGVQALDRVLSSLSQQPEARGVVDEAMVERATMALLGKSHDTAPGVDWRCDRTWTVNKVRKHMRAALTAALAQQPGAVDEAMVEMATLAYEAEVDGNTHSPNVPREAMRAALTAALTEARNG